MDASETSVGRTRLSREAQNVMAGRKAILIDAVRAAWSRAICIAPGLLVVLVLACLALAAAHFTRAPAMLLALVFGMALNPWLASRASYGAGVAMGAGTVLRLGVVLLGARVTIGEIADLGVGAVLLAIGGVVLTISGGWAIGRLLGLKNDHAALSAGAVAICGASAALAIAAVLPRRAESDGNTMLTIVGVTTLSTIAMVLYPLIALQLGFDHRSAGVFLGASIHDVAQVVGAGFIISPDAAETATVVKLTRVACLAPAVAVLGFVFRGRGAARLGLPVPLFVLGFVVLVLVRSAGLLGEVAAGAFGIASQWCLLISVAALGAKTSIRALFAPGWRPLLALLGQTALLGGFALVGVWLLR